MKKILVLLTFMLTVVISNAQVYKLESNRIRTGNFHWQRYEVNYATSTEHNSFAYLTDKTIEVYDCSINAMVFKFVLTKLKEAGFYEAINAYDNHRILILMDKKVMSIIDYETSDVIEFVISSFYKL